MSDARFNRDKYKAVVDQLEEFLDSTRRSETAQRLKEMLGNEIYPQLFPAMDGSGDGVSKGGIEQQYFDKSSAVKTRTKNKIGYMNSFVGTAVDKLKAAKDKVTHYQNVMDEEEAAAAKAAEVLLNKKMRK